MTESGVEAVTENPLEGPAEAEAEAVVAETAEIETPEETVAIVVIDAVMIQEIVMIDVAEIVETGIGDQTEIAHAPQTDADPTSLQTTIMRRRNVMQAAIAVSRKLSSGRQIRKNARDKAYHL